MNGLDDDEEKVLTPFKDASESQPTEGVVADESKTSPHPKSHHQSSVEDSVQNTLAHVNTGTAVTLFQRTHGVLACEEALLRAFLAERQQQRQAARYWIGIYEQLTTS